MPAFSDEELLQELSSGDAAALEILMRRYYAVLCRFAEKFLPDASLAKDVAQESFIKLWKSGKSFDSLAALKAYLYTSTRNGCLDVIRSRTRLNERHRRVGVTEEDVTQPTVDEVIRAESIALIYEVVKSLPEKMQEVFLLSYRDGMSVSEIAAHLGINLKTVKKRKYKVLVALRGRFVKHHHVLLGVLNTIVVMGQGGL